MASSFKDKDLAIDMMYNLNRRGYKLRKYAALIATSKVKFKITKC